MLAVFNGSTDVTQYLEGQTYSEDRAANNRRNTASFTMNQNKIGYGQSVYVYDCFRLSKSAASGQAVLDVEDTFEDCNKFRAGDEILLRIKTASEVRRTILSIDHSAKTVTLTANVPSTIAMTEYCGRLEFAGTCIRAPETEIGMTGTFGYKVQLSDWSAAFDRQAVVDTYEDQWSREITGRIVYGFTANDTEVTVEGFEAAWTQSGVALAMANETTDRLQGTNAQKTGTSGAGTATWSKTLSSVSLSAYTHLRFWWKIKEDYGDDITAIKLRIGTDSSNYFEWILENVGELFEDCWNWESVELANPTSTTGSPTLADLDYVAIVMTSGAAVPTGNILFDHMLATTGGFTIQNTLRGVSKFTDLRVSYKKGTIVLEDIMKSQVMLWHIDENRDIHQYSSTTTPSPFTLTDTSENYSKLTITPDISKLINRIMVRGGEAPDDSLLTEEKVADGVQTNFRLAYKPKDLIVSVNTGAGYVVKTIGVENLVDETTVDFVWSFNDKNVRNASHATLGATHKIKFEYYPYQPIRKRVQDPISIAAMMAIVGGDGVFDGMPIVDSNIRTFEDAQLRGLAELELYSNPLLTATFTTAYEGLKPGQYIRITDSSRSIDQDFLIQQVKANAKTLDRFTYTITAGTSLYGIVEMLQYLLKKSSDISSDSNELVDVVINQDETITITEGMTRTHKSKVATAALKQVKYFDFIAELGSVTANGLISSVGSTVETTTVFRSGWFGEFIGSETGTIQFAASNYEHLRELRITAAVGGTSKEAKARLADRIPASPGISYTVSACAQILAALTNQGTGAGVKVVVKEYATASSSSVLATNTIIDALTTIQDFARSSATFTTNASTGFITIEVSLVAAIGTISVSDIIITASTAETQAVPAIASFCQAT